MSAKFPRFSRHSLSLPSPSCLEPLTDSGCVCYSFSRFSSKSFGYLFEFPLVLLPFKWVLRVFRMIMAFCLIVVRVSSMWINVNVNASARHSLDFAVAVADNLQTHNLNVNQRGSKRSTCVWLTLRMRNKLFFRWLKRTFSFIIFTLIFHKC